MNWIKYQPAADIVGYTTTKEQGNLSFTVGDKPTRFWKEERNSPIPSALI